MEAMKLRHEALARHVLYKLGKRGHSFEDWLMKNDEEALDPHSSAAKRSMMAKRRSTHTSEAGKDGPMFAWHDDENSDSDFSDDQEDNAPRTRGDPSRFSSQTEARQVWERNQQTATDWLENELDGHRAKIHQVVGFLTGGEREGESPSSPTNQGLLGVFRQQKAEYIEA
jgi:hypothetical protein